MRIFYLVKKEFIEIFRQKELLPLLFIAPIIQIIMLGYIVKTDVENIPVEIINLSKSKTSYRIVNRIKNTPLFNVKHISYKNRNSISTLKEGHIKAVIIFRDSFDKNRAMLKYPEIQILMDGTDSNTSSIAAGYFNGILKKYILTDIEKMDKKLSIENKTLIRFNPALKSINYMGPGIVALLLTIVSLFLASASIVREKEQQTMDTLLISRLTSIEIYIGKALPITIIGIINMSFGISVVMLWFKIPVRGNLFILFISAIIFLAAILSYGLLISTIVSTKQQALFFSWFSMITFILLSGLFTPTENIPSNLQFLVKINPLSYLIKIIREIFLKGNGIEYFYKDLFCLSFITILVISISISNFKRFTSK
jgi:ABC-2 type transport system permease protein